MRSFYSSILSLFKTCINFLVFTSLFTALCTVAMCMATERLVLNRIPDFLSSLHYFLIGCTLLVYNVHYLIKKSDVHISDQYAWVQKHKYLNYFFLAIGFILCLVFVWAMPKEIWLMALVLALFSFAYSLPVLPFKQKHRLKDFGYLKILLLSSVWVAVTAVLPILYWSFNPLEYPYEIFLRFLLLFVLCLAFDIRDMQVDLEAGIYTLPNRIGLKNTYRLINFGLICYAFFALLQYYRFDIKDRLLIHLISTVLTFIAVKFVKKYPSDKNFQLFIDGQMLLNGLLIILF